MKNKVCLLMRLLMLKVQEAQLPLRNRVSLSAMYFFIVKLLSIAK